ncbi:hypothetical protein A2303_06085 [Candidatus Falkowbacteria bacterium RIFOXYB2_FULL_47_14]|uniref:Uncharacterized protein n=1 Tax=Candidatus Falkowbacteria bacterium RIFOXYA2_FULL_47_19 TaxID=1797994 RepID=A0A1F5SI70_9BACT|nr:MAG: hypothetical protein A2227_03715 [Candidatus Falkowbacteria bacterium RIFOXYA2_FULL_47_19]OGF35423.1 MAG: hypothetical protein A2468_03050 [Candidatus Falkowbacteria bacterium RIFOXYC2_FULL_46_15]OGF43806.1 MAG: hypothetical protein A2303_06085 [Candidatus Falkowbacteria bacterium RIFOXYB2_FULL_47_14]
MEEIARIVQKYFNTCSVCLTKGLESFEVKLDPAGRIVCANECSCQKRQRERNFAFLHFARHNFSPENIVDFGPGFIILKKSGAADDIPALIDSLITYFFRNFCAVRSLEPSKESLELFDATSDCRLLSVSLGRERVKGVLSALLPAAKPKKTVKPKAAAAAP